MWQTPPTFPVCSCTTSMHACLHVKTTFKAIITLALVVVNSAVRNGDSYKTENADNEKAKAETPAQWIVRLERERDQRTSSHLCFLVGVAILGFHRMSVFSPVTLHKPFFTLLLKAQHVYTQHSGQDLQACIGFGLILPTLKSPTFISPTKQVFVSFHLLIF